MEERTGEKVVTETTSRGRSGRSFNSRGQTFQHGTLATPFQVKKEFSSFRSEEIYHLCPKIYRIQFQNKEEGVLSVWHPARRGQACRADA